MTQPGIRVWTIRRCINVQACVNGAKLAGFDNSSLEERARHGNVSWFPGIGNRYEMEEQGGYRGAWRRSRSNWLCKLRSVPRLMNFPRTLDRRLDCYIDLYRGGN